MRKDISSSPGPTKGNTDPIAWSLEGFTIYQGSSHGEVGSIVRRVSVYESHLVPRMILCTEYRVV